ncbi:MAG: DJ-1/PfpI family protein [Paracoccaceae bacterium]|nr:DJ-1/PfpI family protein [Paracoccaceae bacterium]
MPKIAVILPPGFADWEYAYIAGTGGPFYGIDVRFYTIWPGEVVSQGGLPAKVSRGTDEIADWHADVVTVVGSFCWEQEGAPDISDVLTMQRERGRAVAGICAGTLALARAGLLDKVRHTSNDPAFLTDNAPEYAGGPLYQASPKAVTDDLVITAPGTAPTTFTAAVLEAAGLDAGTARQFRAMAAAEHR